MTSASGETYRIWSVAEELAYQEAVHEARALQRPLLSREQFLRTREAGER